MKFQIRLLLVTLLFSVLAFSCNQDNHINPDGSEDKLQTNEAEYARLLKARTTYSGTTFELGQITREGDVLKIEVVGGCSVDNYKIVWNGIVMTSYPEQTGLVVTYEGQAGETCDAGKKFTLEVDMNKAFGRSDLIVHIANGSKVKDISVDPDGSVTNR